MPSANFVSVGTGQPSLSPQSTIRRLPNIGFIQTTMNIEIKYFKHLFDSFPGHNFSNTYKPLLLRSDGEFHDPFFKKFEFIDNIKLDSRNTTFYVELFYWVY